ncbi:hypothetical protein BASA83_001305 [Batrachochytrium salamandrivorans]|nr:hypothetical protein BASA83_001305 [Batrachochytrium salamandrivorans]
MVLQPFSSTPASGACFANVAKKHTSKRIYSQVLTQQLEYCKAEITVRLTRLQGSQLEPETSAYQHMLPQQLRGRANQGWLYVEGLLLPKAMRDEEADAKAS